MAKRLAKERADLDANPDKEDRFCVESVNNDLEWTMVLLIDEAADCCYAGGIYTLKLIFPSAYPSKPPMIRFNPSPFHTHIRQENGDIEAEFLEEWGPTCNVKWIMGGLYQMFLTEGSDSARVLESDIMRLKQENYEAFVKKVKDQIAELNEE